MVLFGRPYMTHYAPLIEDGNVIGALFVGVSMGGSGRDDFTASGVPGQSQRAGPQREKVVRLDTQPAASRSIKIAPEGMSIMSARRGK